MTISISDLTSNVLTDAVTQVVSGDGVLDDMMETVNAHLEAQFQAGRITGTDYATVYLTAIQATVQQAVTFVLGMESTNAQVLMTTAQTNTEASNKLQVEAQTLLVGKQGTTETANAAKISAEQTLLASKNTTETSAQTKMAAESALLTQKKVTEFGQTGQTGNAIPLSTSVMGAQINLTGEQAKAFLWNAENKHFKILADAWSINTTVQGDKDINFEAIQTGNPTFAGKDMNHSEELANPT